MIEKIRTEMIEIRKKRGLIIFSAIMMCAMFILTGFAWDGVTKRLIICIGASLLCGILLLVPSVSNWISVPLLIAYLYYVPMKIFQRMELPFHEMERIADGAAELTAAFIICVYLIIFLFTQSTAVALAGGNAFFLVLFLIEYYVWKFRGDFLMPNDLGAVGTAISVMRTYNYSLSPEALYTLIYFLLFIVLGARIKVRMHKWVHIGVSAAAVLFIGGWYYTVMDTPNPMGREFVVNYWNMPETRNLNGACLSYFLLAKDNKIDIPGGYSRKKLQMIADEAVKEYNVREASEQKPDIIMIMSEAWSDLRVLGELETTGEYMPYADSLKENTIRGNLYVSVLGGYTANTEFEALTGNSLSLLSPTVIPYQNQVEHDMPSFTKVLEKQGYETMAMHPSVKIAWNRGKVYTYFGFDEFIDVEKWEVPYEYEKGYISDACNYKEIIYKYENRNRDAPFFLFNVTIQNHGGYYKEEVPININVTEVGETPAQEAGNLDGVETYLNLMKISDDDLKELITYFEGIDSPVMICVFGDHQPKLGDNFYNAIFEESGLSEQERNLRKYIVPYIIWANYDAGWQEYGDVSANYLPAILTECAGLQLPPFYQYLMELYREYPVLTKRGCLDKDGNLINITDIWDTELISQYRMLQYNQLYVKDYQDEIFEETVLEKPENRGTE